MGLVEKLRGTRVAIDTAPVIYFVEKHPSYTLSGHNFNVSQAGSKRVCNPAAKERGLQTRFEHIFKFMPLLSIHSFSTQE
ncbi:MAG: hypothetical protein GY801_52740 [bacterium]|nr:hypothetical protein [bacterium]